MWHPVRVLAALAIAAAAGALAAGCGGGGSGGAQAVAGGEMTQQCVDVLRTFNDEIDAHDTYSDAGFAFMDAAGNLYNAAVVQNAPTSKVDALYQKGQRQYAKYRNAQGAYATALLATDKALTACDDAGIPPDCQKAIGEIPTVRKALKKSNKEFLKAVDDLEAAAKSAVNGNLGAADDAISRNEAHVKKYNALAKSENAARKKYGAAVARCSKAY